MWHRIGAVIVAVLVLSGTMARAETASDAGSVKPDSRIGQYLTSKQMMKVLFEAALKVDQDLGIDCKGEYRVKPVGMVIFSPIDLPDGAEQPTSGIWIYRYDAVRCDDTKRYNVKMTARAGELPEASILPPGDTIASPELMGDVVAGVTAGAARAVGNGCKTAQVFDTKVTEAPKSRDQDAKVSTGTWKEQWTVLACGKHVRIPLLFTPDGKGGTKFTIAE